MARGAGVAHAGARGRRRWRRPTRRRRYVRARRFSAQFFGSAVELGDCVPARRYTGGALQRRGSHGARGPRGRSPSHEAVGALGLTTSRNSTGGLGRNRRPPPRSGERLRSRTPRDSSSSRRRPSRSTNNARPPLRPALRGPSRGAPTRLPLAFRWMYWNPYMWMYWNPMMWMYYPYMMVRSSALRLLLLLPPATRPPRRLSLPPSSPLRCSGGEMPTSRKPHRQSEPNKVVSGLRGSGDGGPNKA